MGVSHALIEEKPFFLHFGVDCRTPTEEAYIPTTEVQRTEITDCKEGLFSLIVGSCLYRKSQAGCEQSHDQETKETTLPVGHWVLIHFLQNESRSYQGPELNNRES